MYIDIILPCLNPNIGLIKTLESLEDIKEINKIIIIDDFSIKGIEFFKESLKYRNVILKKNIFKPGIVGALNSGINFSDSNFIGRIDCGDICLDKNRFRKIMEIFKTRNSTDLLCSGIINERGKKVKPNFYFLNSTILPFSRVPHPTWVFRKSSIKKTYNETCFRFEDYAFLIDNKFKIYALDQYDISYDTKEKMNRYVEIKVSIKKSLYYIKNSKVKIISFFIGTIYAFLRIIRIFVSNKKIIF